MTSAGFIARITGLSASLGALIIWIAIAASGSDPAANLADQLGLGGGVILGAILGGLVGLWLALGGRERAASFAGWVIAIGVGAWLWSLGKDIVWVFDVVLEAVFGPSASGLGPFVAIGVLIALIRSLGRGLEYQARRIAAKPNATPAARVDA